MNKLIKVDPKEFGLEENKAQQIEQAFTPMLEKMSELEKEFNKVSKLEINADTCTIAKELRLKYVKVRTGTATIHTNLKSFYLAGGRFVDGWKNAQLFASQGIEEKLSTIEKHFENIEKERQLKVAEDRIKEVAKFDVDGEGLQLGTMSDDIWSSYLSGLKLSYDERIKAEQAEELKLKEEERKENLYSVRKDTLIPFSDYTDFSKLTIETDDKEFNLILTGAKDRKNKAVEAWKKQAKENALLKKEAEKKEAEREKERKAEELKLEKAEEAREKIAEQLRKKEEAEQIKIADQKEREQAELKKGDSAKVKDLIDDLRELKTKYILKSKKYNKMYSDVGELIDKVINHIEK